MHNISEVFNQIQDLNIAQLSFIYPTLQNENFLDIVYKISSILGGLATLMGAIIAYNTINDWKLKIKKENFEKVQKDLVYAMIDLASSLKMHCYEAPTLSSDSELHPQDNTEVLKSQEANRNEINKIDTEITNKFRVLNKNIKLFEFYVDDSYILLIDSLDDYYRSLRQFYTALYLLILKKFSMYLHSNNQALQEDFTKALPVVQNKLKDLEEKQNKILQELKKRS